MTGENVRVAVVWAAGPVSGDVTVSHGTLRELNVVAGDGTVDDGRFDITSEGACRLQIACGDVMVQTGGCATRVTITSLERPFTFFLRDVLPESPIFLPDRGVAVTTAADSRSCSDIAAEIEGRRRVDHLAQLAMDPEEGYETASREVRTHMNETWLGVGRDMRIFHLHPNWSHGFFGVVKPCLAGYPRPVSEKTFKGYRHPSTVRGEVAYLEYEFVVGRGSNCTIKLTRRLEDGVLPILHGTQTDGDVTYKLTAFASFEGKPLRLDTVEGTHFLVADGHSSCHVHTEEQNKVFEKELAAEQAKREEIVLYIRVEAENPAPVPRYAWFKAPRQYPRQVPKECKQRHDPGGLSVLNDHGDERVLAVTRLDGRPMAEPEQAVLIPASDSVVFETLIPHRPVSADRIEGIAAENFDTRYAECRTFWNGKLSAGPRIDIPEPRVNEMVKAGILHLDLITYGQEPDKPLIPSIGHFAALAVESAPIMFTYDVMGLHDVARRTMDFFLAKQHGDGRMANYAASLAETGPVLFAIGEHYRLAGDLDWLKRQAPRVLKACEYIIGRRREHQKEECRGLNYGLFDGGVADNQSPYCFLMSNGYACAGLQRTAEWLKELDPARAEELEQEAAAYREDIRTAFRDAMERAPVVPLRDGTWRSSVSPLAEGVGNYHLYCEGTPCFSHGVFQSDDVLLSPTWLVFLGILDPDELAVDDMIHVQTEVFMQRNVAFGQPYHSRHDYAHLRRDEVKAFLKTYYNGFATMADRETYTWNEHTHGGGKHKTHEEAWFLMQTRWMLLMEEDDELHLLRAVPRAWLRDGKRIAFQQLPSYVGKVSMDVESRVSKGEIRARYTLHDTRRPEKLVIRLPHPDEKKAARAEGGSYRAETESVEIESPAAQGEVVIRFAG